jgi:hypothetical protein
MKTVIKLLAALAVLLMIVGGCGSGPSSKADDLDAAIRDASNYLNNNVPNGSKIVILNIQSSSSDLSDYVIDELIANAVNDKVFSVVDRQQLDAIRAEQNFQFSGEVDDKSAMAIGKFFGAQTIVSGALSGLGSGWRMRIRALEVQTAQVQGQYNRNIAKSEMISALLDGGAPAVAPSSTASNRTAQASPTASTTPAPATPAVPATPAAKAYKAGDTGPAGGLIFYDKGNNSGGWRYLEAAPVEAEFQAVWSVRSTWVDSTQATIGSGKRNTQLIVEIFSKTTGEWDTAAQKCDDLEFGGFDDWFLPSIDELNQMYGNLKRRNLGNFKDGDYWSSSNEGLDKYQNFRTGNLYKWDVNLTGRAYVRPVRQVVGP